MNIYSPLLTERLTLREFKREDWREAHCYLSDPDVLLYMEFPPTTEEQSQEYVEKFILFQKENPRRYIKFFLVLKKSNQIIGECGFLMPEQQHRSAELMYRLNKNYFGMGYATEAAKAMLDFGFRQLALHRIDAMCDVRNTASVKVLEKIGMQKEGRLSEHRWTKGNWRSSYLYAILEKEFTLLEATKNSSGD